MPLTRRRLSFAALASGALTPLSPFAQQPQAVRRIAVLSSSVRSGLFSRALPEDLRRLGYEHGRNIAIEWRFSEGKNERLPAFARELLALSPELIVAHNNEAIVAIKDATSSVPVVMCTGYLPVEHGFVESLARPGGNITGAVWSGLEQNGKVLQILKEAAPGALDVAVTSNRSVLSVKLADLWKAEMDRVARLLGMSLSYFDYSRPEEVESALAKITVARPDALYVTGDAVAFARAREIAQFTVERKLVSISNVVVHANLGGLLYYGPNLQAIFARTASYVDRILRGAKPAELPIELPAIYELVINARTARAIGYKIPQTLLGRADRVIE